MVMSTRGLLLWTLLATALLFSWPVDAAQPVAAQPVGPKPDATAEPCPEAACPPFPIEEPAAEPPAKARFDASLLFFWGIGCSHCEEAKPFVDGFARELPELTIEHIEVRSDAEGRKRFLDVVRELGITAPGIPTFVYGKRYHVGFRKGVTEDAVRGMLRGDAAADATALEPEAVETVELPIIGTLRPAEISLPTFTLLVGVIDGVNPCAMWVLLVLLGILTHVRSKSRMLLLGGAFVLMSGLVYFLFMTVWVGIFDLLGFSRWITMILGVVILAAGLINLKELVWFKKGISLTIPERVKPGLYRRMRAIAKAAGWPAALVGVLALAFVVNLVELGCTLGLPAVYTRILTLRGDLGAAARYGYLALYNLAYIVPLGLVVIAYAATLHRLHLSDRGAKGLKLVSGVLLVLFGLLFLVAPDTLI